MWIDVTVPLRPGMPTFPGEEGPTLDFVKAIVRGDPADVTRLRMAAHTGTHVDAPCHFLPGTPGVEALQPEALLGPCRVVDIPDGPNVSERDLREVLGDRVPERVLLRTRNSRGPSPSWSRDEFDDGFAALAAEGARWLVARGVRLVGIDYLSMEPYGASPAETHLALLGAGVAIVEGLDLRAIDPGAYEMIALPIRLVGRDGAPARVLLRPGNAGGR